MTGTDKQINWANDIKARRIEQLEELETLVAAAPADHPAKVALSAIRSHYEAATDAAWWINHDYSIDVKSMANELAHGRTACADGKW